MSIAQEEALMAASKSKPLPTGKIRNSHLSPPLYSWRQPSQNSISRPPSHMSNIFAPNYDLGDGQGLSYSHENLSEPKSFFLSSKSRPIPSTTRRLLLASPALASFLTWASMLAYFQVYFLDLEREDDGSFKRIGFTYGGYPFISCIGAIRPTAFQTCCIIVACCTWWVFFCDFYIGMRARQLPSMRHQSWLYVTARFLKLFAAICGGAFLIGLSFENVEDGSQHDTHLILTTLQVIGMGGTRFWDFFATREVVKRLVAADRAVPHTMMQSRRVKNLEGVVCATGACILLPAIYGCSSDHEIVSINPIEIKQSAHCYAMLSYAAVFEWIMSVAWLFYILSTGWDLFHLWSWTEELRMMPVGWGEPRLPKEGRMKAYLRLLYRGRPA